MTRLRVVASILAFALAVVLLPVGITGFWAQRTVTDTERFLVTVDPLSQDAEIQTAMATYLADRIEEQINPEQLLDEIFGDLVKERPSLKLIEPVILGAIDSLINQVTLRIVQSDQFQGLWSFATTAAQRSLMAILQGDDDGPVNLDGDSIVLDTSALFEAIKQGLVDRGFGFAANINVPQTDQQIVLLEAPQLAQLRTIYSLASPVLTYLLFLSIGLFVLSVALARRRPRATALVGVATTIIGLGLVIGLNVGRQTFDNTLATTPLGPASTVFYDTLLKFLLNAASVTLLLGLIIFVCGWWLSRSAIALELRATHRKLAERTASALPVGPITHASAKVRSRARGLRIGIAAIFVLIVVIGADLTVTRTIIAALISLLLLEIVAVMSARADLDESGSTPAPADASAGSPPSP